MFVVRLCKFTLKMRVREIGSGERESENTSEEIETFTE